MDRRVREVLDGSDRLVLQYMDEVGKGRGKRIRPRLMIAIAELFGGASVHSVANCAACCELLHTATLIHDDVIDEAPTRRGNLTLNNQYGNEIAVVVGDYMLALVFKAIIAERDFLLVDKLLGTSQELGMGVIQEVLNRNNLRLSVEKYYEVIYLKTASLFALCCELGAYLGGADEASQALAREYGKQLGLAFQVVDDLLDLTVDSSVTGKPSMNDIREGRITLSYIDAVAKDPEATKALVAEYQADHDPAVEARLKKHLRATGSLDFAYVEATKLLTTARELGAQLGMPELAAEAQGELMAIEHMVIDILPHAGMSKAG